jgi:broad specificity phosphatase PhoE
VRIDHLYASELRRAYKTAGAISEQNVGHPEVKKSNRLNEREHGEKVQEYLTQGRVSAASKLMYGDNSRTYGPPGGESREDVANRAQFFLMDRMYREGKDTDELPEAFLSKEKVNNPETLPEGIPHIVVVSHNVLLCELYDSLLEVRNRRYQMTNVNYDLISWCVGYHYNLSPNENMQVEAYRGDEYEKLRARVL